MKFKRVLLKLSGESLQGSASFGYENDTVSKIVAEVKKLIDAGVQVAIVVGGGNIMRGKDLNGHGIKPATADYMGMMATVMNGLYLRDALAVRGIENRVMTAIGVNAVAEPFISLKAHKHLERGRVVILAAGTGSPFATTDTAAALKARELECDLIIKATKVDGIYDCDPNKNKDAKKYKQITYDHALQKRLEVMDMTAFTMCRDGNVPIIVCSILEEDNLVKIAMGEEIGTLVTDKCDCC